VNNIKLHVTVALFFLVSLCNVRAGERTDFKVNSDGGKAQQNQPRIAVSGNGNFIIAWTDYRNASSDIYIQRFDTDGYPIGDNKIVNDDADNVYQFEPAISVDLSGLYSVVWKDYRNNSYPFDPDIFFQRFDSSVSSSGSNINLTTEMPDSSRETPDIALYKWGSGVVVWADYRNDNWDIYGQIISANGTMIGSNFKVNSDSGKFQQHAPRVTVSDDGWFVIAWYDNRNGHDDIYVQRFDSLANMLGDNVLCNSDTAGARQAFPDIAADGASHFTVVWVDWRNGHYPSNPDIYARKFDTAMRPVTDDYQVNSDSSGTAQREPAISADRMGNVAIIWADSGTAYWDITGQMVDVDGLVREENFLANSFADSLQLHPDIALDGRFRYITWADKRNGNFDIYASITQYNEPTLIISPYDLKFEMELNGALPEAQNVTVNRAGYNNLGFEVTKSISWLTVTPRTGLTPDTVSVQINTDTLDYGTHLGLLVFIDTLNNDSSVILSVRLDVTAPIMAVTPDSFLISAFAGIDEDRYDDIIVANSGSGQFSWTASENVDWINLTSTSGLSDDTIQLVTSALNLTTGNYTEPVIFEAVNVLGSPDTVWVALEVVDNMPYLKVTPDSFYIRTDTLVEIDTFVLIENPGAGILSWEASANDPWLSIDRFEGQGDDTINISVDYANLFTGVHQSWIDVIDSGSFNVSKRVPFILDIYETSSDTIVFEPANVQLQEAGVTSIRLKLQNDITHVYLPFEYNPVLIYGDSVKLGAGLPDFMSLEAEIDSVNARIILDVIRDNVDSVLTPDNYILADFYFTGKDSNSVVTLDTLHFDTNSVYINTTGNKKLTPVIIPGDITVGTPTAVEENNENNLPARFRLYQNYPNPFNPITSIEFDLPQKSFVELVIYNILGQEVKTLYNRVLSAGHYKTDWNGDTNNGRTASSGIYFYRLKSSDVSLVKKMVLIK